ncbi:hypothetical protein [Panacagrimonas sp.]|uniref:hypothetical protein n=1 Tax=Panacagrimonas sp. TaxID=2480088 RepID=UPI003B51C67A
MKRNMTLAGSAIVTALLMWMAGPVQAQEQSGRITLDQISVPGVDKDGDGCLDKTEVTPGGQLDKRFATRDVNGDGKLCKDEYFAP